MEWFKSTPPKDRIIIGKDVVLSGKKNEYEIAKEVFKEFLTDCENATLLNYTDWLDEKG